MADKRTQLSRMHQLRQRRLQPNWTIPPEGLEGNSFRLRPVDGGDGSAIKVVPKGNVIEHSQQKER